MQMIGLNGVLTKAADAVIHVSDHGFLYGMGLFETFRTYRGRPFLLDRHLRRLEEGCQLLGIPYTSDEASLSRLIAQLMAANDLQDAYVRYTVSAGEYALGLPGTDYLQPNEVLFAKSLPPVPTETSARAKSLCLLHTRRNTPESGMRLKSLHYMNNILAKRELNRYPVAVNGLQMEGLMLTDAGIVAEGIVSNVFFVKQGRLCTPSLDTGALGGITRGFVMELAGAKGIQVDEGLYTWEELMEAEEVFLTTSVQEISPVTSLSDPEGRTYVIGNGRPGLMTEELLEDYQKKAWG
ncbi:aminotransferase class IV [Paenibacillus massiliensis]|uniref:aminotransferase class IV n=1 Tax=Paenibacillus massiliensis TaxID=225917 RepID=UPI00046EA30E|nr:aminotransferase class IV [Paenibacillus massiliensis]